MKAIRIYGLIIALLAFAASGCSDGGKLSNGLAQGAVDRWAVAFAGTVTVNGVIESPQENTAQADLQFSEFKFPLRDPMFGQISTRTYSGAGAGIFAHYNDGRWVLTQVVLSNLVQGSLDRIHWDNLNIEVTAK